ncbi:hypothetical protein EUTSA_v10027238mg [Eutrema salsugineum]|uniref:Uncharacterized protein n=1 Tax=Eutrema salsugineum TaxID=72664 RepID=V4P953_EUTSA|nr:hypothetical protein EUTSA_v10027238mg [Eutrema salsugineum]
MGHDGRKSLWDTTFPLRGLLGANKFLSPSVTPKGFLAVFVHDSNLSQSSFQAFLSKSEEEFRFDHPIGGLLNDPLS